VYSHVTFAVALHSQLFSGGSLKMQLELVMSNPLLVPLPQYEG
jgi:hypothetical protein